MTAPADPSTAGLAAAIAAAAPHVPGLLVVFLFGSQLSGRTWAESDVDLGVRWAPGLTLEARMHAERAFARALAEQLESGAERLDLADLDRAASSVAFRAVRDGMCVWARSEAERVHAIVRVSRRYDDDAPHRRLSRDAARAAVRRMQGEAHGRQ
jgi:predicted nucleotidyltransferase